MFWIDRKAFRMLSHPSAPAQVAKLVPVLVISLWLGISTAQANTVIGRADLVVGKVQVQEKSGVSSVKNIKAGTNILEGQVLITGTDGYLYINTVDKGFISLRPNTKVTVELYRYNANQPKDTQIRLHLHHGVMRSISGQGAQAARDKYRLNTPVAAIGIRGTDYTVFASMDTTRVTVRSGGVAMAPLVNGCVAQALGPCEGLSTVDLNAQSAQQLLQLSKGERRPTILDNPELRPDRLSPPRNDELPKSQTIKSDSSSAEVGKALAATPLETKIAPYIVQSTIPEISHVQWGRWQEVAHLSVTDIDAVLTNQRELTTLMGPYFLSRDRHPVVTMPKGGSYQFTLKDYEAHVLNNTTRTATQAQITDPSLLINFDNRSFVTNFNVVTKEQTVNVSTQGGVSLEGQLVNQPFVGNATVRGALAGANAEQAGLIFNRPIDSSSSAIGATRWGR
jgi:hypothetical protein